VQLRDLGEHRLRDLARPEHIFQLVGADLPTSFPPLRIGRSLDAHFDAVIRAITEGRIVLFLGEQVNLCGRRAGGEWRPGSVEWPPSGGEVAAQLASRFGYPEGSPLDLQHIAQFVSVMAGSGPLYEALHSLYDLDYHPNAVHKLMASLPGLLRDSGQPVRYPLIVTTSYDDTLERAFTAAGEPFDLVIYAAEGHSHGRFWHTPPDGPGGAIDRPNKYLGLSLETRPVILKIHGAVDRADAELDSFVITEDDYLDYLTRADISNLVPVTLAAKLRKSHYLFLGYSLRDWHLRVILRRLWGEQRLSYKSWAAQVTPDALEQELWRKRDVDVLRVQLDDYVAELQEHFLTRSPGEDSSLAEPL
jgi:hypothetical protein